MAARQPNQISKQVIIEMKLRDPLVYLPTKYELNQAIHSLLINRNNIKMAAMMAVLDIKPGQLSTEIKASSHQCPPTHQIINVLNRTEQSPLNEHTRKSRWLPWWPYWISNQVKYYNATLTVQRSPPLS